jgi:hypothetical protein
VADEGIKKATILPKDLPPMTLDGEYIFRYRIVTEDRKQFSAWSNSFTLQSATMSSLLASNPITYNVTPLFNKEGKNIVTLEWNVPSTVQLPNEYDIYTRWGKAKASGPEAYTISTVTRTLGYVVTATTSSSHGLSVGNDLFLSGLGNTYNGAYTVISVPSTTTFTYHSFGDNGTNSTLTGSVLKIEYEDDEYGNWTEESKIKTTNSTIFTKSVPTAYLPPIGFPNIRFVKFRVQVATTKKLPTSTTAKLFEALSATDAVVGGVVV